MQTEKKEYKTVISVGRIALDSYGVRIYRLHDNNTRELLTENGFQVVESHTVVPYTAEISEESFENLTKINQVNELERQIGILTAKNHEQISKVYDRTFSLIEKIVNKTV